jgi:DNA-binding CsgD family transcriptional regulator
MPRPTRLTPALIDAIGAAVHAGVLPHLAAKARGIPSSTFSDWLRWGKEGRRPFSELSDRIRQTVAKGAHNGNGEWRDGSAGEDGLADEVLDRLPYAVILVDERGRVMRMNQRATEIVARGDGLLIQHDVLRGVRPTDTAALHRLIGEAVHDGPGNGCASGVGLRLERRSRRWPLTALVTPLHFQGFPSNGYAAAAVFVSDPEHAPAIDARMLREWFGLTPAEARLAVVLVQGHSLAEALKRLGVGVNTARSQLKNIFGKTGTNRQAELVRLLLSAPTLAPPRVTAERP